LVETIMTLSPFLDAGIAVRDLDDAFMYQNGDQNVFAQVDRPEGTPRLRVIVFRDEFHRLRAVSAILYRACITLPLDCCMPRTVRRIWLAVNLLRADDASPPDRMRDGIVVLPG
jgi:hypothetical protein